MATTNDPTASFVSDRIVRVKLSGDGTIIGKQLHVVVFTFTLLDDNQATSASGNHILAVFKEPESYHYLKSALENIVQEVGDHKKTVKPFRFCTTWKFLAVVTGIDAASSDYACIWCKCKKDKRFDVTRQWSLTDTECGARSIEENEELAGHPRTCKTFNVSHAPLFANIHLSD